jgi:hypothetical protein
MTHVTKSPFANPEAAARQLVQLASGTVPVQDGRIHIETVNYPFLHTLKGSGQSSAPASGAPSRRAGWSCMRAAPMCGSPAGAELLA